MSKNQKETEVAETAMAVVAPAQTAMSVLTVPPVIASFLEPFEPLIKLMSPEMREQVVDTITRIHPYRETIVGDYEMKLQIPELRINQAVSKDAPASAKLGDWYSTDGATFGNTIKFIVLSKISDGRQMFVRDEHIALDPDLRSCFSDDTVYSTGGKLCETCPYKDKKEKPNCRKVMKFYVVFADDVSKIYLLKFHGASFMTGVKLFEKARGDRDLWNRSFSIKTLMVADKNNKYYKTEAPEVLESTTPDHQLYCRVFGLVTSKVAALAAQEAEKNRKMHEAQIGAIDVPAEAAKAEVGDAPMNFSGSM